MKLNLNLNLKPNLIVKRLIVNICSTLIILFSSHCTFGSEGNSLTDNQIIMTRLALLRDSIKINGRLRLLFYDDQGDDNLESFQLNSGNNTDIYTVTLNNSSNINFDRIEFYISAISNNRIDQSTDVPNKILMHEVDGDTSLSSGSIKVLSTANGYTTSSFLNSNGFDEFGSYSASDIFFLFELPQGTLEKVTFHFSSIQLSGTSIGPVTTKSFSIQLAKFDIAFNRLCTRSLNLSQPLYLTLDIKYSNLLKDTSTYLTIDNTKILRAIHDLPEANPVISNIQNIGIYEEILKNWNLLTTIKEHRCNK